MEETVKEKQVKTDNELIDAFYVSQGGKPSLKEDLWFYESDWSMLMPVVEKIENGLAWKYRVITENELYLPVETVEYRTTINDAGNSVLFEMPACSSRIESVYKAVVEFIKWYNTQTLPPIKQ